MNSSTTAIQIKNLNKIYPNGVMALKGIDLNIQRGDFYGLLGPNGAGKSTTIGILSSLIPQTSGDAWIGPYNIQEQPSKAKELIGVVPQEFNFNMFESCLDILVHQAGYYGVPRHEALKTGEWLLKELDIWDKRNTPSMYLSGGQKRRLMIARAMIHRPDIVILDEPTAGVDIQLRRQMWDFFTELNRQGTTIILTTHYLEEAESLCKNLAIIDQGLIIKEGKTAALLNELNMETFICYSESFNPEISINNVPIRPIDDQSFELDLNDQQSLSTILSQLQDQGITVQRVKNKANRLEELFVKLIYANDEQ